MKKAIYYREEYLDGIKTLIESKRLEANILRKEYIKDILKDPNEYRKQFVEEEWLRFMTFDGTHEFCKDDKPIEMLICDLARA